ncbi:MAG: SDR family NAD(P)-dependent oxidoreductase, partial [Bacteroidota bacterium]
MSAIIVTGAGKGIGYELVKQFAANGHQVVAVSRNLSAFGEQPEPGIHLVPADLSVVDTDELVRRCMEKVGPIDVLINN